MAQIVSIQVGKPAELRSGDESVISGIVKNRVDGPVMVRTLNIDGDGQADLRVHGGVDKAVYCYPLEHYEPWQAELGRTLEHGNFGENLTVSGLLESELHIGAMLAVGDAVLQVSQPRLPCFKLGMRMNSKRIVVQFQRSGRSGFYCRVIKEGIIEAGQAIEILDAAESGLTVAQVAAEANK